MSLTYSNPDFTSLNTLGGPQVLARVVNSPFNQSLASDNGIIDGFANITSWIQTAQVGDVFEINLSNGNYIHIRLEWIPSASTKQISTKIYENGSIIHDRTGYVEANIELNCTAFATFFVDDNEDILAFVIIKQNDSTLQSYNIMPHHDFSAFVAGAIPPLYTWSAWDQIAGNSGQYRCNLTMIKDDSIGDFSAIQTGDSTDFTRISSQASLMNIFHNMSYGVEQKVAWSGSNYLTMELATVTGLPNQVDLIFRFYIPASSSSAVYTQRQRMTWNGTYRDKDIYLSFIHDDEQQAAILLPVLDNYYTGQYSWGWSGGTPSTDDMLYVWLWLHASGSPQADSPYSTGTTDNGGTPGGPTPQDHIQTPSAPALDGTSSGMFTIYCPDDTELQRIASFLWDSSTINSIHKYFNNFSDNIISLYVLPYKGSNLSSKVFTVGNLSSSDTDLSSVEYVTARFVKIDMGSVTIKPFWDSYLDYSPYSKMEIYLPGCGVQQLDVDDIMCPTLQDGSLPTPEGSTISLEYMVDLMTGIMVAYININGELRYQFPGKIGYSIPLTGENHASLVRGYVTATAGLIGMVVTGGAAAPFAAGAAAAGIINAMKSDVYRGGNLSGDASMLSYRTPYLIYRRPNKPLLTDQEKYTGFPSYKIDTLSNFSGYTEVIDCHVEGISCTDEEREKILAALKGGVII